MPNMDPKKCPMPSQEPNVRNKNFKEVALGYTEEMAVNEAKRCLQCKNPLIMMKFVVKTTKPHNVKTVVSMNPIMVDGTGMCGGCRLTVGGQTKFACVDGPDFDGFEVDFDEAMHRGTMYKPFEAHAREAECNLLKQEVQ